jgi:16S rRNA (uracil1498-N3)-methyltransferase
MTVALVRDTRVERWRRVALASTKQSRRAVVPEIRTPLTLDAFLGDPPGALRLMLVEPAAAALPEYAEYAESLSALQRRPAPADAVVLVGPEGGWTEEEWSAASARGVRLLTLGHRTLRADAVPIAAISVLQFVWGDL